MSIFDKNTQHPIETLYDQCKDIVQYIIPMNMMHYNGDCETMKHDIEQMLRERDLLAGKYTSFGEKGDINKISNVFVEYGEYVRRIPTYKVKLFYVKKFEDNFLFGGPTIVITEFLAQFTVGISGIINEPIR